VKRFNQEGLNAINPRHGGGHPAKYGPAERERILREVRRKPDPKTNGTATWSLKTLCQALRKAPDGLPEVSEDTIRNVLLEAGFSWQASRSWCKTGTVIRKRKRGTVTVTDPDASAKNLIENAYRLGEKVSLAVWIEDEAGPYQTLPYPGDQLAAVGSAGTPAA
jgi:transposase